MKLRLREKRVVWQRLDGDVVVLDLDTSDYLRLNATAGVLWEELAAGCSEEHLASTLSLTYRIEPDRARQDVDAFVRDVLRRGLVEQM